MDKLEAYDRWLANANEALQRLGHEEACWWGYSVSHQTFRLIVNPSSGPNVAIMLIWCNLAAGPTRWCPQHLTVGKFPINDGHSLFLPGHRFFVEDSKIGFRAEADWLGWRADVSLHTANDWWPPQGFALPAEPGAAPDPAGI
jgi:hypothetical protein